MKVLVQRVSRAEVRVDDEVTGRIGRGVVVLLGVETSDDDALARWYAARLASMKLFPDEEGSSLWRRTLGEVGGGVLVVSQFTLAARTRKGRRPSFDPAAPPEQAEALYEVFVGSLEEQGLATARGRFGAMMQVELVNEGPVTFLLDGPASAP